MQGPGSSFAYFAYSDASRIKRAVFYKFKKNTITNNNKSAWRWVSCKLSMNLTVLPLWKYILGSDFSDRGYLVLIDKFLFLKKLSVF